MTLLSAEGVLVSDPKPKDEEIEARGAEGDAGESPLDRRPPKDLPEELVMGRLGRLDTRRALAELRKSVPGRDEVLPPRAARGRARRPGRGAPGASGCAARPCPPGASGLTRSRARRAGGRLCCAAWRAGSAGTLPPGGPSGPPCRSRSRRRPSKPSKASPGRTWKR